MGRICCDNPINIGCVDGCLPIKTPCIAMVTGEYKVHYSERGVLKTIIIFVEAGKSIVLPNVFADNADVMINIEDPQCQPVCGCIRFYNQLCVGTHEECPPICIEPTLNAVSDETICKILNEDLEITFPITGENYTYVVWSLSAPALYNGQLSGAIYGINQSLTILANIHGPYTLSVTAFNEGSYCSSQQITIKKIVALC